MLVTQGSKSLSIFDIVKVGSVALSKEDRGGPLVSRRLSEKEQVSASLCVPF